MTREWSATESAKVGDVIAVAIRAVSPAPTNGAISNHSETSKSTGSRPSSNSPTEYRPATPFGRVFSLIDARSFQDIFVEWTKRVWEAAQGQVVAIDGKTGRRSADKANGESPIHMASGAAKGR